MATYDARKIPSWATDPASPLPLGFEPATREHAERFYLGIAPNRAFVIMRAGWRKTSSAESFVKLAIGAWRSLVGSECDVGTAAIIAKRWLELADAAPPAKLEHRLRRGV